MRWVLPACVALSGLGGEAVAAQITTKPDLYPRFDRSLTDYVIRCDGNPVAVHVEAPAGTSVAVDRAPARGGIFDAQVPVTSGQAFSIRVGDAAGRSLHHVRCLPADFPRFSAAVTGTPQASFYVTAPSLGGGSPYAAIFDAHGVPVWWAAAAPRPINATYLADNTIAWTQFPGDHNGFDVRTLANAPVRHVTGVSTGITDEHELERYPNGDYLVAPLIRLRGDLTHCGGAADGELLDTPMQRVRPDGALVWSWSTVEHIPVSETLPPYFPACRRGDPHHFNSIEAVGESHILISYRHLDAVYKVDVTTGEIVWKMGGTPTPESLEIIGDPRNGPVAQHDARWLGDGTITIHDNRTGTGTLPRAIRYRIDEAAGTATLIEELVNPEVTSSGCCGSARRLPGGNWVMSWGGQPVITEQTPAGGVVFRLDFSGVFSYRAQPLTSELTAPTLRRAMNEQNPRAALARASGTRLHYQSGIGQANDVTVSLAGGQYTIHDASARISPEAGCTAVATNEVRCPASGIESLQVVTQDGNDSITQTTSTPSTLDGGPGADTLAGGAGADTLIGGAGGDLMQGRGGDDILNGYGGDDRIDGSGGDDTMTGGAGADILNGNNGVDTASYAARARPVVVTLDLRGNDGAAGEHDNVRVEAVMGGRAGDRITGDDLSNWLTGGPGADVLRGLGGDDTLLARDGLADTSLECDGGADSAEVDTADPTPSGCETVSPG